MNDPKKTASPRHLKRVEYIKRWRSLHPKSIIKTRLKFLKNHPFYWKDRHKNRQKLMSKIKILEKNLDKIKRKI